MTVDSPFTHMGLLYRDDEEYLARVGSFVDEGLAAGEPVLVTAPATQVDALRARLGDRAAAVEFADMLGMGANPARIIPAVRGFLDRWPGRRVRAVGQPTWPGLTPAATRQVTRMEALTNLAFAEASATFLCPYQVDGSVNAADPTRTHPHLLHGDTRRPSPDYSADGLLVGEHPEPDPAPAEARWVQVSSATELADLRGFVSAYAARLGVPASEVDDFLLSVTEAATNALEHGGGRARIAVWTDADEGSLICEVRSAKRITDPMTGCVLPRTTLGGGRGMWLINQLCDLAETHSGPWGTVVRMHLRLPTPPST